MMSANSRLCFSFQIVFVCLYITPSHYHHFANFIWRHWAYKMPVRYILSSVWVRLSIFSQLSIIQYMGAVCFQFTHFICDDWDNIYTLSYYHHQIGSMNYYPLFRVRSWNNAMRCMSFYILSYTSISGEWCISYESQIVELCMKKNNLSSVSLVVLWLRSTWVLWVFILTNEYESDPVCHYIEIWFDIPGVECCF